LIECKNSVNNDGVLTLHLAPSTSSDIDSIIGISAGDKTVTNKCAVIRTPYSASQPSAQYNDQTTGYNTVEFCASGNSDDLDSIPGSYTATLATHDQLKDTDIPTKVATYITNEVDIGNTGDDVDDLETLQSDIKGIVACSDPNILTWSGSSWSCVDPP
jgi:hypothetical protein